MVTVVGSSSRTDVIELDVDGSDVNQTILNTQEHRESVYVSSMLKRLPSKTLDHVGDTSQCSFCVVTTADDWDCVAVVERRPALHYSIDFILFSFGIMGFLWEL